MYTTPTQIIPTFDKIEQNCSDVNIITDNGFDHRLNYLSSKNMWILTAFLCFD